jgi:hypothetical protein
MRFFLRIFFVGGRFFFKSNYELKKSPSLMSNGRYTQFVKQTMVIKSFKQWSLHPVRKTNYGYKVL